MTVEMQRSIFEKLAKLETAVYDLVIANLTLQSQLDESHRGAEMCMNACAAQFGTELRLR